MRVGINRWMFDHHTKTDITQLVGAIVRNADRILLCLRSHEREHYPDLWDVPGGHVVDGESLEEAIARELEEELGIRARISRDGPWVTERLGTLELHLFMIEEWDGEVSNCAPVEHDEVRWVTCEDLASLALAHPRYNEILPKAFELPRSA